MAAAEADHPSMDVNNAKSDNEDTASFFVLTPSPEKTSKRSASAWPTAKPLRFKTSPAGTPRARSRQPSPSTTTAATGQLWTDTTGARHERLTTVTTLDEVRQQLVHGANQMAGLKAGIERVFKSVCGQQAEISEGERQSAEQNTLYLQQHRE